MSKNVWILKPGKNSNRGAGIVVISTLDEVFGFLNISAPPPSSLPASSPPPPSSSDPPSPSDKETTPSIAVVVTDAPLADGGPSGPITAAVDAIDGESSDEEDEVGSQDEEETCTPAVVTAENFKGVFVCDCDCDCVFVLCAYILVRYAFVCCWLGKMNSISLSTPLYRFR